MTCVLGIVRGVGLREEIRRPVKQTVREGAYGLENATSATSPPPRGHAPAPRSGGTSAELGRLPPRAVLASYCFFRRVTTDALAPRSGGTSARLGRLPPRTLPVQQLSVRPSVRGPKRMIPRIIENLNIPWTILNIS